MSATNRSDERVENDVYDTPEWCVVRLLDSYRLPQGPLLEPCAGTGGIIKAYQKFEPRPTSWFAVELRPECAPQLSDLGCVECKIGDFLDTSLAIPTVRGVITNPPYSIAQQVIERSLAITGGPVVMLLRLNFLASRERQNFFANRMPDIYVLPDRPSFKVSSKGSTSDATDYGWFVWPVLSLRERDCGTVYRLPLTSKAELQAHRKLIRAKHIQAELSRYLSPEEFALAKNIDPAILDAALKKGQVDLEKVRRYL